MDQHSLCVLFYFANETETLLSYVTIWELSPFEDQQSGKRGVFSVSWQFLIRAWTRYPCFVARVHIEPAFFRLDLRFSLG